MTRVNKELLIRRAKCDKTSLQDMNEIAMKKAVFQGKACEDCSAHFY